ncbi:hypothetical protein D1164_08335 [Mariniphaga sediminis]|uniref:Uncharacterized protein n=1 Tax=Mariniphaga sediminis TaxID=1628158 RepID=A0A399D353_9BACT|nr:hypothetical protein D1164_08335 [Mariniphaga sediminis]
MVIGLLEILLFFQEIGNYHTSAVTWKNNIRCIGTFLLMKISMRNPGHLNIKGYTKNSKKRWSIGK